MPRHRRRQPRYFNDHLFVRPVKRHEIRAVDLLRDGEQPRVSEQPQARGCGKIGRGLGEDDEDYEDEVRMR